MEPTRKKRLFHHNAGLGRAGGEKPASHAVHGRDACAVPHDRPPMMHARTPTRRPRKLPL